MVKTSIKFSPVVDAKQREALDFKAGDNVRVTTKIIEGGKTRLQAFEGLVLARKHGAKTTNAMFTVRKVASGVGVERIFPLHSPLIEKIEITRRAKRNRRSKLYYVRDKAAKEIRKKMKQTLVSAMKEDVVEENDAEAVVENKD